MSKKEKKKNLSDVVIDGYLDKKGSKYDPDGSWTGVPLEKGEKPIQDADDL